MGSASAAPQEPKAVKSQPAPMASLPSNGKAEDEASDDSSVVQLPVSGSAGTTDLAACPFCGTTEKVELYDTNDNPRRGWRVACCEPECDINPFTRTRWRTAAEAIFSWNRRAATDGPQPADAPQRSGGERRKLNAAGERPSD
jgi:hypothetical protein